MANEIYFFTESYTYKVSAVATSSGGNDIAGHLPNDGIDYDVDSYWENDAALPILKIDLGAAYTVDSLWFKHANIDTYTLYYSTDDIVYNAIADGTTGSGESAKWLFTFTAQTAQYWRFNVTAKVGGGNTKVYEILLMEQRLAIDDELNVPAMVNIIPEDKAGGGYQMADGSYSTYAGERSFVGISMKFQYTPKANRDNLHNLFSYDAAGNPVLRSLLVIFPDDEYPEKIYRVLWKSTKFPLVYQIGYKGSGFGGTLDFQEY